MEIHPPHGPIHSPRDFALQLVTITAGILIALSLEGLVEWNHHRNLVNEAKETIAREIADNKKELAGHLAARAARDRHLDTALKLANELLTSGKSDVQQFELTSSLAELSDASWRSAERTGALAYMNYADVQAYARVYGTQELYATQQRQTFERLAAALAILGLGDPHQAPAKDVDTFRQKLLELKAHLTIDDQLGEHLQEAYEKMLSQPR